MKETRQRCGREWQEAEESKGCGMSGWKEAEECGRETCE